MPIDTQRLVRTFSELVAVDSPSFGERAMADLLRDKLAALGISCKEDGAGEKLGGTAGGGSELTREARSLVDSYVRCAQQLEKTAARILEREFVK